MEEISKFECTFDNLNLFKSGDLKLRFEAPQIEIAQVVRVVTLIDKRMKVNISLIEDDTEFIVDPAYFYKLNIYNGGNSKFEFVIDSEKLDIAIDKIAEFVEQNAIITVYGESEE